jgi:phosphate transport system protein
MMDLMKSYTDQGYAEELQEIRDRLLLMASRVENMIDTALQCLVARDADRARETILEDHIINQDEMDLDALCLQMLACRQPMASDLRFITITLKMVTDLERIADLAVNVCERVCDLALKQPLAPYIDIPTMAKIVRSMIHDAIDGFIEGDVEKARQVIERDDEVDDLYHKVFRHLLELMNEEPENIHTGIHVQSIAKYIERMGDHATNIAEQVIFMLEGLDIRHEGKLGDDAPSA